MSAALQPDSAALAETGPLDLAPFRAARLRTDPYPYVVASGCVRPESLPALRADFPHLERAGYHPTDTFQAKGAFAALLAQIEAGALDRAMTEKFAGLGPDFTQLPRLVTVRYVSAAHEGRPHTDGERKVATLLIYLHHGWASPEGRIRALRSERIEDVVEEVPPDEGNIFAFLRSDHSWHGHTPFTGERRVVQVTWLRDAAAAEHKRRHGNLIWKLKGLFGR
ncbi:MAG TPA: 2OG-Fe(II) oxygenase [Crenalkalicoccus sp.]|nr:2OG-Fe(II) oxygenase [Crenalkalicoccus sp.]